ncbi:GNAT family acetyltransferase [Bifidobacterium pseudolongum subsp. globosum]|nr:GNAT family acetyltransferase [Bifidobacterium pseudolongum subsp. globosum]
MIRIMTPDDYDAVVACWTLNTSMGLNTIDDSRQGISRYLERNPTTSFVRENDDGIIDSAILAGHDGRRGSSTTPQSAPNANIRASAPHSSAPYCMRLLTKASSKSPSSFSHTTMQATPSGSASASLRAAI